MSSPPYTHPGPSSYYQHPQPHYMYGTHSPGPYPYPYPPHGNALGHLPPMHQSPTSPARLNGARGTYIPHSPSSAGPSYQNLHPAQHYIQPQHIHSPHAQPYNRHPQPHSIPYSPTYPTFSPSWSAHQPLSPLPKQLSMPPPRDMSPLALPFQQPPQLESSPPQPSSPVSHKSPTPSESQPSPPSPRPTTPPSHRKPSSEVKFQGWPILSRRPDNPARAPGVLISPLARPPEMIPEMILRELELLTPSARPKAVQVPAHDVQAPPDDTSSSGPDLADQDAPSSSVTTETTPASSTAPDTPMQGSPLSSTTSISGAGTSPGTNLGSTIDSPKISLAVPTPEEDASAHQPPASPDDADAPTSQPPPAPPAKKSWASLLRPATPSSASTSKKPNTLPTSSVVGISIPASSPSPAAVSSTRKGELLALLTSPAGGTGVPLPAIRARGLVNSGNMCFANSVLQVLMYCPPFHRLFSELGRLVGEGGEGFGGTTVGTPLVDATIRFLKEFEGDAGSKEKAEENAKRGGKGKEVDRGDEEEERDSFIPSYVYDAMKEKKRFDNMRGGHQEDAEEFFGFYLDTLEEELLSIVNSISPPARPSKAAVPAEEREENAPPQDDGWLEVGRRNRTVVTRTIRAAESPITRIFEGKFRSTLRAPGQKDSVIIEDWRSLRLDIQREHIHTVQDALAYISHPQAVHVTSPTRPGVTIEASQQVLIEALPPVLVLHMKRFLYDTGVGGVVKVGRQVRFEPELEVRPDVMAPAVRKAHPARYKLFGVLYHHGLSAGGGHYTLDVLHPNLNRAHRTGAGAGAGAGAREGWVRIDDDVVAGVASEDVFGGVERDDRCAYLLFYRRMGVKHEKAWN